MAGRKKRKNRFGFLTKKFPLRMQRKLVMLFMAVILAFVVLIGRITWINASKGSSYTKVVLDQQSYNSRVNRWKGVGQATYEVDYGKAEKFPTDKKQSLIYGVTASILIVVAVLVTTLLCLLTKINFVLGLLIVSVDIICIFMAIILFMMLAFNSKVGKKIVGEGEIVGGKVD